MVEPISGIRAHTPLPRENPDHIVLAKQMKMPLQGFVEALRNQDPSLFRDPNYLQKLSQDIADLHNLSSKALNL